MIGTTSGSLREGWKVPNSLPKFNNKSGAVSFGIGMTLEAYFAALFNFLFSTLNGKVSSLAMRRGISPFLTTILIVAVIAVGGVIIYLVVISGTGQTTTIYP
jgi:hypothetical protein